MNGDSNSQAVIAGADRPAWRRVARRVLPPLFSVAIVVAVFWYFLPQFTSISAVWVSIRSMTGCRSSPSPCWRCGTRSATSS